MAYGLASAALRRVKLAAAEELEASAEDSGNRRGGTEHLAHGLTVRNSHRLCESLTSHKVSPLPGQLDLPGHRFGDPPEVFFISFPILRLAEPSLATSAAP